jgi:hypothetical protein
VEWSGTHTGPLATPQGEIEPTGRTWTARTCLVCRSDGETIKQSTHYLDLITLMQQLGLLPANAAA